MRLQGATISGESVLSTFYKRYGKRMFDVCVAVLALVVIGPLLGIAAIVVLYKMGRPVLFRQTRVGLNGETFAIAKVRTMKPALTDDDSSDAERLTSLGYLLRRTSVDEVPELWNVICGDMSLVGPRPLLVKYLKRYTKEQARRHEVRPGITGWAQVNGRNALSWEEKFNLDVWYVKNCSLMLDLKILALTVWKVMRREAISQPGHATAEEFKGSVTL